MKTPHHLLIALAFVFGAGTASQAAPKPTAEEKLKTDEQLDKIAGLLSQEWTINKISMNSHVKLPPQLRPGLPPYSQQPEQVHTTTGSGYYTVIIKP